jgi:hypothetical protein
MYNLGFFEPMRFSFITTWTILPWWMQSCGKQFASHCSSRSYAKAIAHGKQHCGQSQRSAVWTRNERALNSRLRGIERAKTRKGRR